MKILRLLNSFFILFFLLFIANFSFSNEPEDIWDIKNTENDKLKSVNNENTIIEIEETQYNENSKQIIFADENLFSSEINLIGLYDPKENNLNINMWKNSDGDQLKSIINKINKKKLSDDAMKILEIALMTN